ncbi:MAG: HAMP domain-containing histidine kinase [Proteobacteria bacterium]|jgi:signal transduction histidine kinase|nr:HAMP domain-containing histidine kinase [Pseudomonadota bacterium]
MVSERIVVVIASTLAQRERLAASLVEFSPAQCDPSTEAVPPAQLAVVDSFGLHDLPALFRVLDHECVPVLMVARRPERPRWIAALGSGLIADLINDPYEDAELVARVRARMNQAIDSDLQTKVSRCVRLVVHDLNSSFTVIGVLGELLRDDVADVALQDLDGILESADMAASIVESLGSLCPEQPDMDLSLIRQDLTAVVRQAASRKAFRNRVFVDLPRPMYVLADSSGLHRVIGDVMLNARFLTKPKTTVKVTSELVGENHELVFSLYEPGVPPDLVPTLMRPFGSVVARARRVPVSATGLWYAAEILAKMGGQIRFDSVGSGTELRLVIPAVPI